MMGHKADLMQKFGQRLEFACQQAEDAAVERAKQYLVPGLEVLGDQVNTHKQRWEVIAERTAQELAGLSKRCADFHDNIHVLHDSADTITERVQELSTQLSGEAQRFNTRCEDLESQVFELRGQIADERHQRTQADNENARSIAMASEEAAKATRRSTERADDHLIKMQDRTNALEVQLTRIVNELDVDCLREAKEHTDQVAGQLRTEFHDAMARADQRLVLSDAQMAALVEASIEALKSKQAEADKEILKAAENSLERRSDILSSQFLDEIDRVKRQIEESAQQSSANLHSSITDVEARLTKRDATIAENMESLKAAIEKGDSGRIHLRRALQAESQQHRTAAADVSRAGAHAVAKTEARFRDELVQLREELKITQRRIDQEAGGLRAEVQERSTLHEVAKSSTAHAERCREIEGMISDQCRKLEHAEAGISDRVANLQQKACEVQDRSQQEIAGLGLEISQLRTATAGLTDGVVKALQIIGLLESSNTGRGQDDAQRVREFGDDLNVQAKRVEVEDLLRWEKSGNTLAARVSRQWQEKQLTSAPTLLAALNRRLDTEEHAVAKEFLRNATVRLDSLPQDTPRSPLDATPRTLPALRPRPSMVAPMPPRSYPPPASSTFLRQ